VWLLGAVHVLAAIFYAFAVPLWHAPDEQGHVDLVRTVGEDQGFPEHDGLEVNRQILASLPIVGLVPVDWRVAFLDPWTGLAADQAPPREARPSFDELAPDEPSGTPNHVVTHPPLYYGGLSAVATATASLVPGSGGWSWDQQVSWLRLLNALLVFPLPLLVWGTAMRLTGRGEVAVSAAVVTLAVPMFHHIAGSVNNDNLLNLATAALLFTLGYVWTGDLTRRTAVWVGLVTGVALLAKAFALGSLMWVAAAYHVGTHRARGRGEATTRKGVGALAVAGVVALLAGGWWYVRQLVVEGALVPRLRLDAVLEGFDPDEGWWAWFFVRQMTRKFWGYFGIEQFQIPWVLILLGVVVVAVGVAASFHGRWVARRWRWADPLMLLTPFATTLVIVVYGAWDGYATTGFTTGVQGRYLFATIPGTAVLVAAGWGRIAPRWAPAILLTWVAVLQAAGALTVVSGYWAGGDLLANVRSLLAWSPWAPELIALSWLALVVLASWAAREVLATTPNTISGSAGPPRDAPRPRPA
jgi:hypothetical protein